MKNYPLAKPEIIDQDILAVEKVLKTSLLSRGPTIEAFEAQICQVLNSPFACAVSSGSAGLIMALQSLGVGPGDEVITVSFTVSATVNSIVAIRALPVMVDIEPETLGMCPQALSVAITKKTKAIIVVHAFGKAAKISEIMSIANTHNIPVIEDACEAIGNQYQGKALGTFAHIGVFGFYPNKQITTGEGGMLVTHSSRLYDKFLLLRNHGRSMNGDLYDQINFGWNFRMSDINAALGLSQVLRLEDLLEKRKKIAAYYFEFLSNEMNIICPEFKKEENSAWFVYVIQLTKINRDETLIQLKHNKIQCGRYFAPVHLQPFYREKYPQESLKNTEEVANQCLALPFYTELSHDNIKYICDILLKVY
jgi:perosamine synthetase